MKKANLLQVIRSSAATDNVPIDSRWSTIEKYVATGEPSLLNSLQPIERHLSWTVDRVMDAIADPCAPTVEERRVLEVFTRLGWHWVVAHWLKRALASKPPVDEEFHAQWRAMYDPDNLPAEVAKATLDVCGDDLDREGRPSSAGRFVLSLSDAEIEKVIGSTLGREALASFLLTYAPDRAFRFFDAFVHHHRDVRNPMYNVDTRICQLLLSRDPQEYEAPVATLFREEPAIETRLRVGALLTGFNREKYGDQTTRVARELLAQKPYEHCMEACLWLLGQHGPDAFADVSECLRRGRGISWNWWAGNLFGDAYKVLGCELRPLALLILELTGENELALQVPITNVIDTVSVTIVGDPAITERESNQLRLTILSKLIEWNDPADRALIAQRLQAGFRAGDVDQVIRFIGLATGWELPQFRSDLLSLVDHKSKQVRATAARALGKLGDGFLPKAIELLRAAEAPVRDCAVTILAVMNSDAAAAALEERLDEEPDDDIRDKMLLVLEAAWEARGRKMDRPEIEGRIKRAAASLESPVAPWLNERDLPPLRWTGGEPLDARAVRYLLYRQSRAKEMRPDVEAKPLYDLIDRATSADFALALLKGFLSSPMDAADRWALAIAGLLGDDRVVPIVSDQIRSWVDKKRGKLAEWATQALALLNSDAALAAVDALALRYRSKQKNIGKAAADAFAEAAERLGVTTDELGDRVVPWLGFEPGRPRLIDCAGRQLEVRITNDFKFEFYDVEKKKRVASLPSGAPKELKAEFKDLSALLREVVKGQIARLENLMVRQFRWPVSRWGELYLLHPLLFPFATRLIWGFYDAQGELLQTYRVLDDRTFTDERDEPVALPAEGTVGIIHPLELSDQRRQAWRTHLSDYAVDPPFEQIERPAVSPAADELDTRWCGALRGTQINGMTFKGRAERFGWLRGSVASLGTIPFYRKSFPGAGVDAILTLQGMFVGIGMGSSIELLDYGFVASGSVVVDEPADSSDARLIAFAHVPPVVFSETVGDLKKLAGAQEEVAQSAVEA